MPIFTDLEDIKNQIHDIGNQPQVLEENNQKLNDTPIPDETIKETISTVKDEDKNEIGEIVDDLMGDIMDDLEGGGTASIEKIETPDEKLDSLLEGMDSIEPIAEEPESVKEESDLEAILDNIDESSEDTSADEIDTSDLDELLGDVKEPVDMAVEDETQIDETSNLEGLESLLETPTEDTDIEETSPDDLDALLSDTPIDEEIKTEDSSEIGELESLIGNSEGGEIPSETIEETMGDDLESLMGDISEPEEEETEDISGMGDLDALMGEITEDEEVEETSDEIPEEIAGEGMDNALKELAGDFKDDTEQVEDKGEIDDILEQLGEEGELSDLQDLDSLLKDENIVETPSEEVEDLDLSSIPTETDISEEEILEMPDEELGEKVEDISGISADGKSDIGDLEDISKLGLESIEDVSHEEKSDLESLDSFDLESIESLSTDEVEQFAPSLKIEEEEETEEKEDVILSDFGEIPEELSQDDIEKDKDIEINLSDDERKQIIITLRNLPKEAEIKIARAIASGKYSNQKLKPLIDTLIESESPNTIIRYYERITGDRSLARIRGIKYAGLKFEERQKSLSYRLQKNLLPILSGLAVASVIVVGLGLFSWFVIRPAYFAGINYKKGLQAIENYEYDETENYFEEAFNWQPRYKEVVKYARKYREKERWLAAEKKYELAAQMKPADTDLILEYGDFFREKGDFERAEKKYKTLLKFNNKNLDAMNGLANTYMDWSNKIKSKLNDAEQIYLDMLDIDPKNKEAVYGKLNIQLKKKNHKEILKHYRYIENNFGKKIDPEAYAELAEYLIDVKEIDNVKDILEKAYKSTNRKQNIPEIDYQYARYNNRLQVYDEEKKYLERSLKKLERMQKNDLGRFNSEKYSKLLSKVFNDLGENHYRFNKSSLEAQRYFNKAINADIDNGKAYYNLGNYSMHNLPDDEGYRAALDHFLQAENKGFTNDNLHFNLGWLHYRNKDYDKSLIRISNILDKYPYNTNLKFLVGTIYYKMQNYELSESWLLETYMHYSDLGQQYSPLEIEVKEDKMILNMLWKSSNNLGATYQKKYEDTKDTEYLILATKYYSDSINYFHKIETDLGHDTEEIREKSYLNLKSVLYPYDTTVSDPLIYEDFDFDFMNTL